MGVTTGGLLFLSPVLGIDGISAYNDIAAALLADETVSPILYPTDESCETYDYAAWADS